ncbi:MAG TPA: hypothetical protein VFZ34_22675 [Blastocatellia bacterium]|nr:hypothetical protein [Blastocatellia bacterium]
MSELQYQSGFGNEFATEAIALVCAVACKKLRRLVDLDFINLLLTFRAF